MIARGKWFFFMIFTLVQWAVVSGVRAEEPDIGSRAAYETVRHGDTLAKISFRVFGTHKKWKTLFDLNKDRITDANRIFVGMKIRIEVDTELSAAAVPAVTAQEKKREPVQEVYSAQEPDREVIPSAPVRTVRMQSARLSPRGHVSASQSLESPLELQPYTEMEVP